MERQIVKACFEGTESRYKKNWKLAAPNIPTYLTNPGDILD